MVIVGWLAVALAAWLLDSAVRNRAPIVTLKEIVMTGELPVIGKSYPAPSHLGSSSGAAPGAAPASFTLAGGTAAGQGAAAFALAQVGKPYVWGGTGPDVWDCSGLTQAAWASQGFTIPRTSIMQGTLPSVPLSQLQVGDLVTYYNPISHVGLYIGGGQVVSAINEQEGIHVKPLNYTPFASGHRPKGA